MQQMLKAMLCACALTVGLSVQADTADVVPQEVSSAILEKLQNARPDFAYGAVTQSPLEGVYQVQIQGGPLVYVSASGDYVLTGTLLGVTADGFVDVQELALQPVRKAKLDEVEAKDEIVFPAEGKRKAYVYVFTDVDCGYCRKLHQEVPEMNAKGIEVRYLAYPRAGIGSPSYKKIAAAWCAKDPAEALTRLKNGLPSGAEYCEDNPVASQFNLGGELGVRGTPAIILEDGKMLPGYVTAAELEGMLGL